MSEDNKNVENLENENQSVNSETNTELNTSTETRTTITSLTETTVESSENTDSENEEKKDKRKKKKPFIVRLLRAIIILILVLLILIAGWFTFCFFNKTSSINALPKNYTVYVRTDSAWNAIEPLMDLKAADILLSDPNFVKFREIFMTIRESKLRTNPVVSYALSRRIDAALYEDNNFLAIVDMGLLSGATRLSPVAMNFVNVKGLSYSKAGNLSYFEFKQDESAFYARIYKNLVLVSSSKEILDSASTFDNIKTYSENEITFLQEKLEQPFRIAADGKKLLSLIGEENEYVKEVVSYLSSEELSSINFGITDSQIDISIKVPYEIQEEKASDPVAKLLSRNSKVPLLISKFPEAVQYYTFMTVGTLQELKDSAFKLISLQSDMQKKWQNANNISQMLFSVTADELLFSWTGDEYAVLGLEGKAEPVFVIKVADEKKRQYIFDTILSSIILKSDNSLILDGIRLPRIEIPLFLLNILDSFGINLPKPYYMVKDGFVYFSQSPENLASINAAIKGGTKINRNENWQKVSEKQDAHSAVSLYYNLERSIPFFVKGNNIVTKILKLYNIGRADVSIKDNTLNLHLNCYACENTSIQAIPGFPIALENKVVPVLSKSPNEKGHLIFWQEGNNLKSINTASLEINSTGKTAENSENASVSAAPAIEGLSYSLAASDAVFKKTGGEVWAVTKDGTVYLFKNNFELAAGFPIITGEKPSASPCNYKEGILIISEDGILIYVDSSGSKSEFILDTMNDIKTSPAVYKDRIAVYERGFVGTIHILNQISKTAEVQTLSVDGIAYGSPCITEINHQKYTAIITQTGKLTVWNGDNSVLENFPVQLDDIFYTNVKACPTNSSAGSTGYFVALSQKGILYKIDLKGNVVSFQIPHLTAKSGYITISDYNNDKDDEIFICGDGNVIFCWITINVSIKSVRIIASYN